MCVSVVEEHLPRLCPIPSPVCMLAISSLAAHMLLDMHLACLTMLVPELQPTP